MWLYVPLACAAESVASTSALEPQDGPGPELCVTSNGKPTARPLSWPEWRKRPWIELLSGTISAPCRASGSAAQWMESLGAFPASPIAAPAEASEPRTSETSGQIHSGCFARRDRDFCSWRTLQPLLTGECPEFSETWPTWGSLHSGVCSVAAAWEPRTCESASSFWPTPDAANKSHGRPAGTSPTGITPDGRKVQIGLREVASHWPTPVAGNSGSNQGGGQGRVGMVRPSLTTLAGRWPTPKAQDWKRAAGGHDPDLQSVTGNWQTPRASAGSSGADTQRDGSRTPNLQQQTRDWPTPTSNNKTRPGGGTQASLDNLGSTWPTPTGTRHSATETGSLESLASGHQAETQSSGATSPSRSGQARRLNPAFVEWMMGFPPGWSLPTPTDPTAFAHWETLLAHQLRLWLGPSFGGGR